MPSDKYNDGFGRGERDRAAGTPQTRESLGNVSNDYAEGYFHGSTGTSSGGLFNDWDRLKAQK